MSPKGKYIYAIIGGKRKEVFGPVGMDGALVSTVNFRDLGVVVSDSEVTEYPMSRENLIAHQKVLERVMGRFAILPVRFCTIAEKEEDIKEKVLKARYGEFKSLLSEMEDKVEMGVKASWADIKKIFAELVGENRPIKELKEKIEREKSEQRTYAGKIRIGELVKTALEEKKEREAKELLSVLKPLATDFRKNSVYGDKDVLNAAFLVEKAEEKVFDRAVAKLDKELAGKMGLKYIGPVPPCNFVEVVVTW